MPRAFDPRERSEIIARLKSVGTALFRTKGPRKTTVEELAGSVGIAKGSFYSFFESKELLFFEILEERHEAMRTPLLSLPDDAETDCRAHLESKLRELLELSYQEPLINFMGNEEELHSVVRRVPKERLLAHESRDRAFLDAMIDVWHREGTKPDRDEVAARLTSALLVSLRRDFFGERLYPLALDAALEQLLNSFLPASADYEFKKI